VQDQGYDIRLPDRLVSTNCLALLVAARRDTGDRLRRRLRHLLPLRPDLGVVNFIVRPWISSSLCSREPSFGLCLLAINALNAGLTTLSSTASSTAGGFLVDRRRGADRGGSFNATAQAPAARPPSVRPAVRLGTLVSRPPS